MRKPQTYRLPEETIEEIRELAKGLRLSQSDIIVMAVMDMIKKEFPDEPKKPKR